MKIALLLEVKLESSTRFCSRLVITRRRDLAGHKSQFQLGFRKFLYSRSISVYVERTGDVSARRTCCSTRAANAEYHALSSVESLPVLAVGTE